jgi:hypothetical protein
MEDADLADGDLLSNKVKINLYMLGALMLNGVSGEVDDADVFTIDQRALRQQTLELMEQLSQPSGLSHTIGNSTVLGLHAGMEDSLPFDRPGHQIGPQEDRVAWSGVMCVRTPRPVSVCVDDEVGAGRAMQEKAVLRSHLKVAQDVLHSRQVGLPRVVHMQINLLHNVGDVGSGEHHVLKITGDTPKLGSVLYRRLRVHSKLRLDVDWSRTWLAISHGRTLKNLQCVGALVKKHPIWAALDGDAEEVVKGLKILHGKFLLESRDGATHELHARCG